ncbi:DUF2293 domain-containing protein [Mycolicibacterium celeriflavum]|uniref:DUF2293 domain-containing protein n=1 Tax=Mycolicibacterium celeriflavum TaxID=1249101 RepID=UPI003CF4428A
MVVDVRVRHAEEAPYADRCDKCGATGDVLLHCRTEDLCLDCAGLGHLEFLPAGSAAFTRRAVKASRHPIIVLRRNIRRFRFERQGILAEPAVIEAAAMASLADADVPGRDDIAAAIREQFPGCPTDRAGAIALHTAVKLTPRTRRRYARPEFCPDDVRSAVTASVLHVDTDYDELVASGVDRDAARAQVSDRVDEVLRAWRDGVALLDI